MGSSRMVGCSLWVIATTTMRSGTIPNKLSIIAVMTGTTGSSGKGNTIFFTKFGCETTEVAEADMPPANPIHGSNPVNSQTPNPSLLLFSPGMSTCATIMVENTTV